MADVKERIRVCADWIAHSRKLVVFTGAGISTDSGLPDYRGPDGVWTRRDRGLPPPKTSVPIANVQPNKGHRALVDLQSFGKLWFLISQNVDNLHLKSGIDPERCAELHGNGALMKCVQCDRRFEKQAIGWDERRWGKGYRSTPPVKGQVSCPCGGRIISSVVNFGDPMPEKEMDQAAYHSKNSDLFVAIGSSLAVSPANNMPLYAMRNKAKLVIINQGATQFDASAALLFGEGIGDVLPPVVALVEKLLKNMA